MKRASGPRSLSFCRSRGSLASAVALTLALSGCGSTVAVRTGLAQGGAATGDGLGTPLVPGSTDAPRAGTATGTGGFTQTPDGGTGVTPGGGLPGGAAPTSNGQIPIGSPGPPGSALPPTGRGYDTKKIYVGFPTNNDASSAAKNLGLAGLDFGDQIAQAKAVVADLNRRGGLFGRTVVAVIHDIKTTDLQTNAASEAQATCDAFTQDQPVVAVVNIVAALDLDVFFACLAKYRTPLFSGGFVPVDNALLRQYSPYLYKLTAPEFDTFGPLWLDRLTARGYFTGWNTTAGAAATTPTKVGLLYADAQPSKRIFVSLKKQLTARGITVGAEVAYSVSSLSNESSAMSSAVLTFRNNGVSHVLSDASDVTRFMAAADSQQYKPRYGLNTYNAPVVQAGQTPGQLVGSVGVGWIPQADVAAAQSPGQNAGEPACRKAMQDGGQVISSYGVALVAFSLCDGVHLAAAGILNARSVDAGAIRSALSRVGPTFPSALTFTSGISGRSPALPGAGRDFAWNTSCSCFGYLDKVNHAW